MRSLARLHRAQIENPLLCKKGGTSPGEHLPVSAVMPVGLFSEAVWFLECGLLPSSAPGVQT